MMWCIVFEGVSTRNRLLVNLEMRLHSQVERDAAASSWGMNGDALWGYTPPPVLHRHPSVRPRDRVCWKESERIERRINEPDGRWWWIQMIIIILENWRMDGYVAERMEDSGFGQISLIWAFLIFVASSVCESLAIAQPTNRPTSLYS